MAPYVAPAPMADQALSSASVLAASAGSGQTGDELRNAAAAVRRAFGRDRTIWAALRTPNGVSWELYWYNNCGLNDVTYTDVRFALDGLVEFDLPEELPAHPDVLSIDLGVRELSGEGPVDHVNIYSANPAARVISGVCHRHDRRGVRLTGIYHQFQTESRNLALTQMRSGVHLAERELDPELLECASVHVAYKASRDGVYYSGNTVAQLLSFVRRMRFDETLEKHLSSERDRLRHLRFDIGTDFVRGRRDPVKLAIYGVL